MQSPAIEINSIHNNSSTEMAGSSRYLAVLKFQLR